MPCRGSRYGCAMQISWRQGLVFGIGLLLGILAAAAAVGAWYRSTDGKAELHTASAPVAPIGGQTPGCTFEPALTAASEQDGKFSGATELTDKTLTDIAAYASVGADAVHNGRVRDAEVALITSCRIAGQIAGAGSSELAEAKYQLARHYITVAAALPAASAQTQRDELLRRSQTLFSESADLFAARRGQAHEKTRLAASGLTLARQTLALAGQLQVAQAQVPEAAASAPLAQASAPVAGASAVVAAKPKDDKTRTASSSDAPDTSVMGAAAEPKKKPRARPKADDDEPRVVTGPAAGAGSSFELEARPALPPPLPASPAPSGEMLP